MRHLKFTLAFTGALFAAGAVSAASVSIDTFDTGQNISLAGDGPTSDSTSNPALEAIGGNRGIFVERLDPATGLAGQSVIAFTGSGIAAVATAPGTTGIVRFSWSAGGADLTAGGLNDRVRIGIIDADFASIQYTLSFGGISETLDVSIGTLDFLFSSSAYAGVDFSDVDDISLTLSGPASFDTSFEFIAAVEPTISAVPLPAGGVLLVAGLGALGLVRRKRS